MLVVVVGFVSEDGVSTVKLFQKEQSDHLVGEGHGGQRQHPLGSRIQFFRKAVGPTDEEYQFFGACGLVFFYPGCKLPGGVCLAFFIQ